MRREFTRTPYRDDEDIDENDSKWSTVHRFYAGMGSFCIRWQTTTGASKLDYLHVGTLYELLKHGRIDMEMFITKQEILYKGKADGIVKTVALMQILSVLIQCIA
ncbi:hypothetical protein K469DRAFT_743888 [Zopfia rhizophila CBS 207.26]|uniref:Uncharacterized protein n=1 Tax=Zopfia rhizophila CBS 207.26 TaxID=1314779 RepID=A0A6A6EZD6_9PEZI|nr:hypothetical protein K469DRAFT_743888 [Zopfia rhizophila CBS 207.26]